MSRPHAVRSSQLAVLFGAISAVLGKKKLVRERGRRMRKVKIATLNVGSKTGRSGEIAQLMRKKSLQVLCVHETKWK